MIVTIKGTYVITAVNPQILQWARERSGLSLNLLAEKMKRDPSELKKWEDGELAPSYTVLEELAYSHFKIPLALFFFPTPPPDLDDAKGDFRRLPNYELERMSLDTIQKIRSAQAYQDSLEEFFMGEQPEKMIQHELDPEKHSLENLAEKARIYIGITLGQQFNFRSNAEAFKSWRHALEEAGVFTFKDSFKDRYISGFCLIHENYPIIMVNNSNSHSRQIFTLMHELGHIIYGVNGVTDIDESYMDFLSSNEKRIEILCNRFAAEVLVPTKKFQNEIPYFEQKGVVAINDLSTKYSVSREIILRRLLDFSVIDNNYYLSLSREWNEDYLRSNSKSLGGNWYNTKIAYLGESFVKTAFYHYHNGIFDAGTLATHLNTKAINLKKLESYIRR